MAFNAAGIFRIAIANDYVAHRVAAAPPRWHWTEIVAVPVAATSMLIFALALAADPWARTCDPASIRPYAVAALLLLVAADLLFEPRRAWSRSRSNAAMKTACVAAVMTLIFCVVTAGSFVWPVLYPLLIFPLSMVLLPVIALGFASRIPMSFEVRRWAIVSCLLLATASMALGTQGYQSHIACRWPGP
jgi:hypothetical protein